MGKVGRCRISEETCHPKHPVVAPALVTSPLGRRPPDCLGPLDKLLGQTALFGQQVDVVKTWDRGSGGEEWRAPALGCMELQWQTATLEPHGSRRIQAEGKLVSFTLGEPDAQLFDLGSGYAEVKPSELIRRTIKAAGLPWSPEEGVQEDENFARACQIAATLPQ